jgi:hypothetical protein
MGSGLPRKRSTGAHDWGQVLTFEGQTCSHCGTFTNWNQNDWANCNKKVMGNSSGLLAAGSEESSSGET